MSHAWTTADLPGEPDYLSPSGASQIRLLPGFAAGDLAHAAVDPGDVAKPAVLSGMTEFYFVLEGRGELWRGQDGMGEVVELRPGRCTSIPPGVSFQYRTDADPLRFLVATTPAWRREGWHESPHARWPDGAGDRVPVAGEAPWRTADLRAEPDYLAPDGSEIRLLLSTPAGGLAEARLPAVATAAPVSHKTVEEVWFVIAGEGELWRSLDGDEELVDLHAGRCVTIPRGAAFQFRARGEGTLRVLIATMPEWPGAQEATVLWVAGARELDHAGAR